MKQWTLHAWIVGSVIGWSLTGCGGMRRPESRPDAALSPPVVVVADAPPVVNETGPSGTAAPVEAPTPVCTCAETKSKPQPKPRPKPVHKQAPPQPATAPVVLQTPAGGMVDAEVKTLTASVMSILGKRVKGPAGEDLGRVVDVLADASGRVRVAIIDFGGFLGVGNHRIAVDWPLLRFSPGRDPSLLLSISREKLGAAPEYKEGDHPQTLMEPQSAAAAPEPAATVLPPAAPNDERKK